MRRPRPDGAPHEPGNPLRAGLPAAQRAVGYDRRASAPDPCDCRGRSTAPAQSSLTGQSGEPFCSERIQTRDCRNRSIPMNALAELSVTDSLADAPTVQEAESAIRTLIRFIGENPDREGLRGTPARVIRAYREWFGGYRENPVTLLERTFEDAGDYGEPVELRDIPFHSICEHHMAPIRGKAHVAYLPVDRVVGISKLARVVDACA